MATTIQNQFASINAAASHFALLGFHVSTKLSIESNSAICCIYFHELRKKEGLKKAMQCFADEGDEIKFHEYKNPQLGKFYTIELIKELAL